MKQLPGVIVATAAVLLAPLAAMALAAQFGMTSWIGVTGVGVAGALVVNFGGHRLWSAVSHPSDLLFSELMIWQWLRRVRADRKVRSAACLLDSFSGLSSPDEHERRITVLENLAASLEARDAYTHGHSGRVARHAEMIAKGMGLPPDQVAKVRGAAAIHDIGKLNTPLGILNKPGKLTDEEFEAVKRHPSDGAEMAWMLGDAELAEAIGHHHERLDGSGYPDGLSSAQIPLSARIIAVADTFDAITSKRPYRGATPHKVALDILKREAGTQLDPRAVKAFLTGYSRRREAFLWTGLTALPGRLVDALPGTGAVAGASGAGIAGMAVPSAVKLAAIGAVAIAGTSGAIAISSGNSSPEQNRITIEEAAALSTELERGPIVTAGPKASVAITDSGDDSDANLPVVLGTDQSDQSAPAPLPTSAPSTPAGDGSGTPGAPGNSGNAPGHSGSSPGNSGNSPGHSGGSPGNSGNAPGHSGGSPGHSGNAPGKGKKNDAGSGDPSGR